MIAVTGERMQDRDAEREPTGLPGQGAAARYHDPDVGSDIAIIIAATVSARR